MKRKIKIAVAALCVCFLVTVAYAATAGSSSDPLVTLSYLQNIFTGQVEDMVDQAVKDNEQQLTDQLNNAIDEWDKQVQGGTGASFQVVTLSKGQTLVGDVGCEVMLRIGTASCTSGGSTGLIDTTAGTVLAEGEDLVVNHLYMVTISTRSVTATSGTVKVLARGPYTIK